MGLSFYEEKSLIESIVESLHFECNQANSTLVTGDDGIQGRNDSESDEIEMVNR
jgi:hypothetical protein